MVDIDFLRKNIDFTNISPIASNKDIEKLCELAIENKVKTIYVPPVFLSEAHDAVHKYDIDIGTTAGFPYGNIPIHLVVSEMQDAAYNRAKWVDVCLNLSMVKSQKWNLIKTNVRSLKIYSNKYNIDLKLIIETPYLTKKEITRLVTIIDHERIDYIKTATGVGTKVTLEHIKLIKPLLSYTKLKASGGINTLKEAEQFFEYGADKVGSSKGFEILNEAKNDRYSANST